MNWTAADILRVAPEFASVSIPVIDSYSALADLQLNEDTLGDRYKQAGIFLTCHLMSVMPPEGANSTAGGASAGPVTGVTVGEVSTSFGALSTAGGSGTDYSLSRFGLMYQRIVRLGAYGIQVL
jgi:hypothetical protein